MNRQTGLLAIVGMMALSLMLCVGILIGGAIVRQQTSINTANTSDVVIDSTVPPITQPATATASAATETKVAESPATTPTVAALLPPTATPQPLLPPTATAQPTVTQPSPTHPAPPTAIPAIPPPTNPNTNYAALEAYLVSIQPLLEQGAAIAERDGAIMQSAENNPSAVCGGPGVAHATLLADADTMHNLHWQLSQKVAPVEAAQFVHRPLLDSIQLWAEALDNINTSCTTSNQIEAGFLRLGAILQVSGSVINFNVAYQRFIQLAFVYGIQAITGQG